MMSPATPSDVAARTVNPISSQRWSARERRPHWRMRRMTVATATNEPPVSSATRSDGASKDIRSHGTATTASETAAAPTAASDTEGSAGLRAGPCSIFSTLRTSEPAGGCTGTDKPLARPPSPSGPRNRASAVAFPLDRNSVLRVLRRNAGFCFTDRRKRRTIVSTYVQSCPKPAPKGSLDRNPRRPPDVSAEPQREPGSHVQNRLGHDRRGARLHPCPPRRPPAPPPPPARRTARLPAPRDAPRPRRDPRDPGRGYHRQAGAEPRAAVRR